MDDMAIIKQGVSLPKARRIFFTGKNYPQKVDTDNLQENFDIRETKQYNKNVKINQGRKGGARKYDFCL